MAVLGYRIPSYRVTLSNLIGGGAMAWLGSALVLVGLAAGGDALAGRLGLPVPGSLLGGVALAVWLVARPRDLARFPAADALLRILPLLFVPLIVGAAGPLRALGPALVPVAAVILLAALAGAAATAVVARLLLR